MIEKVRAWFIRSVWPALKPAAYTALFTFLGIFGASLVGFLQSVAEWLTDVSSTGTYGDFPDVSIVARVLVSALAAAVAGLVNWAWRQVQWATGAGSVPTYGRQRG